MSTVPTAIIKIDCWWNHPERHGAMFDLAASEDVKLREGEVKAIPLGIRMKLPEGYFGLVVPRSSTCIKHGIMMANSVGIIEPDYCGDNDVWGFVAYAVRDTAIAKGTRIAQFMPVPMFGDLDFDVVDSMPYTDRGGYGSTGEKSNGGEPSFYDRRGRKLSVGCYCRISGTDSCGIVKKLYESEEEGCTNDLLLAPPDSWEKLIDDLRNAVSSSKYACECAYLNPEKDNCEKCPALNQVCSGYAIADILARIEKLRGESDGD